MLNKKQKYPIIDEQIEEKLRQSNLDLQEHNFAPGQLILKKGEVSERVHIIVTGEVRVFIEQEWKVQLALLQRGHFFGEMSCLTGDPISANVEAVDEVGTVTVCRAGMMLLMDQNPNFRMQILEAMIKRIQTSNDRVLEEHTKSVLIMKEHEHDEQERHGELIGESAAMQRLLVDIEKHSTKQAHTIVLGEPGTGKMNVARKLHYLTTKGHYPILTIHAKDFDLLTWNAKVHAAKGGTIVVENAEQLPINILTELIKTNDQTRVILSTSKDIELGNIPTIFIAPLRERVDDIPLLAHFFLEKEGAENAEMVISQDALRLLSLFPFLTNNVGELRDTVKEAFVRSEGRTIYSNHLRFGRTREAGERPTIGLALGSGAARGMAHLGVLRILEQEGIPIDMIAGTSAGSLVGGAYAAGMPIDECEKVLSTIRWGRLVRPTFPIRSFVHNSPMIGFIEQYLGKRNIEDLSIPFAAVASDTSTGDAHIMKSGSLAHAISASTAIPAIMRPVSYEGKNLIDGAVVHPVPAALVKSMGADIVIAVNVCPESFAKGTTRHFVDSLMNTIDMMSAKMVKEELQLADVVLKPDLGFNQISFKDAKVCIAAGEVVTREAIRRIHSKISRL
ncbi:patatin-like phospholipase family protein [Psychrobacillus sp.]|uniref:patatin-like phospholipase family protein n=1 Tax=Psychrobacillus sp. TaxID=1871623 RepID=UPI0028BD3E32|nr:patatin-like phospholipase family protein [Psychrobacillus sp.]